MNFYPLRTFIAGLPSPFAALLAATLLAGCTGGTESDTPAAVTPSSASTPAAQLPESEPDPSQTPGTQALEVTALSAATYQGILDFPAVTLRNGEWVGEPYDVDGATRPRVTLVRDFQVNGDLDGDARDESVVFLETTTGGSGAFLHLAVMGTAAGERINLATEYLGDRVQIIDARIDHDQILITLVRAGPEDAACCPGEIGHLAWQWVPGEGLLALSDEGGAERLSAATLSDTEWVLTQWSADEPAAAEPRVTLSYSDGRLAGFGGCNGYFTAIEEGEQPGAIRPGPVGSTRMACPEEAMAVEQRFLTQLQAVQRFEFFYSDLLLTFSDEASSEEANSGVMRFTPNRDKPED